LIANRGEIAVRIARTAKRLGVRTVAVFTEPDRYSLHPQSCDQAVCIPDYLDGNAIIAAAKRAGASAVHPGFGFLAENASFAAAVADAGLIWVGPSAHAIEVMGSKAAARAMMADAGVPVLPGYDGDDQTDATLLAAAENIGWPVIVKASAGGGGKGMQVVESTDAFLPALAEARRLALSAFGDDRMIVERYLPVARHIEVQVIADSHGRCVHLWERECSIQRRHQKVIEEAPSPVFVGNDAQEQRETLCKHAVRAAEAVDYEGAGTVEFVMDANGQAYFLEMNTRLQVEHPVTECITGLDLVELQLRVAAGEPLGVDQAQIHGTGWAVEARLYAEDPDNNYLPSIGRLHVWDLEPSEGVRVDAGVESGSDVSIHYDPMLAKVIAMGPTRHVAVQRLDAALSRLVALGVTTNRDHLIRILRHPDFVAGNLHTRFLDDHADALAPAESWISEALAAVVVHDFMARSESALPGLRTNWRNNRWRLPERAFQVGDDTHTVSWQVEDDSFVVDGLPIHVLQCTSPMKIEIDGRVGSYTVITDGTTRWVRTPGGEVRVECLPDFVVPGSDDAGGGCSAPMPGKVIQVLVKVGDTVESGDPLVVLEAMKMEQTMRAPHPGTIVEVRVQPDDQVEAGAVLVGLEEE
jgi:3-methylcrotonyl-CoA carboxylase alpha subunit